MAHMTVERVRVLHLNSRNMLIRDENMGDGSIDQAAIYVREVVRRAIDLGSASLILVHNHPTTPFRSRWITLDTAETPMLSPIFLDCVQGAVMANWGRLKGRSEEGR